MLKKYEKRNALQKKLSAMVAKAEIAKRELTEKEQEDVDELTDEIVDLNEEVKEEFDKLNEKIKEIEDEIEKIDKDIEDERVEEDEEDEEINNNKRKIENKNSMKEIRLISILNKIANGQALGEEERNVVENSKNTFGKSGVSGNGNLFFQMDKRSILAGTAGAGKEIVATDKQGLVLPLRADSLLNKATVMSGLIGDVSIPTYAGSSVAWKGEVASATDGKGAFGEVLLQPKRLTTFIDVSKQFLLQDGIGAEQMLQNDIVNAVSDKLEQTLFGSGAGSATQPAGVFNGVTPLVAATKVDDVYKLQEDLENKNVKSYEFIVNPSAKFNFKTTELAANSGRMVMEGGEIDGKPVTSNSNVVAKGALAADLTDLVVGMWGVELTVDPYSKAGDGQVRLVVNAYVDAKWRRNSYEAIIVK